MKSRYFLFIILCLLLAGCPKAEPGQRDYDEINGNAIVDWVDFVMLNGHSYKGLYEGVIADPEQVTDKAVGRTTFKVADVVSNPGYKTRDGDAAFLPIGTELYRVKGFEADELIASRDPERIGGYRLYAETEFVNSVQRHYGDVPKDKTVRIELYRTQETKPYKTLQGTDKERFIQLLDAGQDVESYIPPNRDTDPIHYQMVFYADGPIAHSYAIFDEGEQVYFSPWTTRLVDPAIRTLLQP